MTPEKFLLELAKGNGAIVSSAAAHEIEIADARVTGRWFQIGSLGFILRTKDWRERAEAALHKKVTEAKAAPLPAGTTTESLQQTAENLLEAIGGDLCICQRQEVPHWCESCQRRIQLIREALKAAASQGWQPIESYSDDGEVVIVWNGQPYIGYYQDPDGWFADVDGELLRIDPPPTLWTRQPLRPDPPKEPQ